MKRTLTILLLFISSAIAAQITPTLVDSIPMSDGQKLPADIYLPSGWTSGPTILIQTPYNRLFQRITGLPLNIGWNINSSNYAIVITDWRGFYGGAGAQYSGSPSHGEDGYSTVEWIATQSWSNGKIGTWGPSALGNIQYMTARQNPPHLTCMCPLVAGPQTQYQEYYPNGCLRTEYVEQLDVLGFGTSAFVLPFPFYTYAWSGLAEPASDYPDSILVPCFMIGGWYDHNIEKMLDFFNEIRVQSPANVQNEHRLLMGPWAHGGTGTAHVGTSTQGQLSYPAAEGWSDSLALAFFDYHLRSLANGWNTTPYVQYFRMGQDNWQGSPVWPPAGFNPVTLYFQPDNSLSPAPSSSPNASFTYLYDPNDPSPTVGGPTLRSDQLQGPYDQSDSVEVRNDILIFTSPVLAQDMTMAGNAVVHLEVSSDKTDTDFDIRLCDVYPTGESMLVNNGCYRMRFRNGFAPADTAAMIPGNHYSVDIELPATSISFLAGHQIRVDVSSSNYPMFNRNMNTDQTMYPNNNPDTLVNPLIANNTIYVNSQYGSYITLPSTAWPNGIEEAGQNSLKWNLFPNPAHNEVVLTFENDSERKIRLVDVMGRVVKEVKVNGNRVNLSLEGVIPGVYFLETGEEMKQLVVE